MEMYRLAAFCLVAHSLKEMSLKPALNRDILAK